MNKIQQLQIVLIDTLQSLRTMHATNQTLPGSLRHIMQNGKLQHLWDHSDAALSLEPWQQSVLHTLPAETRPVGLAAAALCWCGEGGALRPGTWMQAKLVHFAAGMNDVHIMLPEQTDDEEVRALMNALQPLLSLSGFELYCSSADHWYIWCAEQLDVQTHSIHAGITTSSYDVLPTGKDAPSLRRLFTEIQMLLHQHPLNQQRERSGLPMLNALWFSGAGSPVAASVGTAQRIMSDQSYVQGLCEQLSVSCWPVPRDLTELLQSRDGNMVLILNGADIMQLDSQWITPLSRALRAGYIQQLNIHLDQLKFTLQGGRVQQLRRWLSSGNELTELLN